MNSIVWGLLGPDSLASARRTRTLGLGAVVREFNERAVPGMGGVWFAKQVVFALLGIEIASRVLSSSKSPDNIRAANAVEALSCFIGLQDNNWLGDARLRGKNKMYGQDDLSFAKVGASSFYVTQPMRMATVQTLPALGLVQASSSRFNSYRLSERGQALINACAGNSCYYSKTVIDLLVQWVEGESYPLENNKGVRSALSPLKTLESNARAILHDAILRGQASETPENRQRRQEALNWVERLRTSQPLTDQGWEIRPLEISAEHWHDLKCGAALFGLRDAALYVLDRVEHTLGNSGQNSLTLTCVENDQIRDALDDLRQRAEVFIKLNSVVEAANLFAKSCAQQNSGQVLAELLSRDGRVIRLVGNTEIRPGSAYLGILPWLDALKEGETEDEIDQTTDTPSLNWPEGISGRIPNLFLFNADLKGDLDRWIINAPVTEEEA